MASWIRYALLLAVVVAMASCERDLDSIIPGRPVPDAASGIQPLSGSAGVQTKPLPRPSQQGGVQTKPLPRPSQQGGFAVPDPSRPQVEPKPQTTEE